MTRPEDESRTELAWREIVEHYGERPVLDGEAARGDSEEGRATEDHPRAVEPMPDDLADEDEVEAREEAIAAAERFRPPPPPPLPRPRTWQRGLAWSGIFVAPALALLIGLLSIYVPPVLGWALVVWFVGGFLYLVRVMPRAPRDPWDDGSRV